MMFPKPSTVRLEGEELAELRMNVWGNAGGRCECCGIGVLLDSPNPWMKMDLKHNRSRGAGGEDTPENTECWCHRCHMQQHTYGESMQKPCPPKVSS